MGGEAIQLTLHSQLSYLPSAFILEEDVRAKYDELWGQGWRLKLLEPYVVNGNVYYTAVWRPSWSGEYQVYGWSYADFRARYDELWQQGWRLKILRAY